MFSSAAAIAIAAVVWMPTASLADEGGVSFWLPGQFGSLAAVPGQPGFSFASVYYHTTVDAEAGRNFRIGGGVQSGLHARADLALLNATYTAAMPILGARASFGVTGIAGRNNVGVDATLTGPLGNTISGTRSDTTSGIGDLYPMATLKWNMGVHNTMVYMTGDIPVGSYSSMAAFNDSELEVIAVG
jgi:hypothetical protein